MEEVPRRDALRLVAGCALVALGAPGCSAGRAACCAAADVVVTNASAHVYNRVVVMASQLKRTAKGCSTLVVYRPIYAEPIEPENARSS